MILFLSATIAFAYRLASASVGKDLVCLVDRRAPRDDLGISTETNHRSVTVRLATLILNYQEDVMAAAKKKTRGRKQDRARVAAGQDYEARYESRKTGRSAAVVKKAVKKVGNSRKRVEKRLGG
jgi:uncharacterized protein DUF3606